MSCVVFVWFLCGFCSSSRGFFGHPNHEFPLESLEDGRGRREGPSRLQTGPTSPPDGIPPTPVPVRLEWPNGLPPVPPVRPPPQPQPQPPSPRPAAPGSGRTDGVSLAPAGRHRSARPPVLRSELTCRAPPRLDPPTSPASTAPRRSSARCRATTATRSAPARRGSGGTRIRSPRGERSSPRAPGEGTSPPGRESRIIPVGGTGCG